MRSNKHTQELHYGPYLERVTKARKYCNSIPKQLVAYNIAQRLRVLICKYTTPEKCWICDEWLDNPKSFIDWWQKQAQEYRVPHENLRLRRKDVMKDYSPDNCFIYVYK